MLKPSLKQVAVHRAAERKRRHNFTACLCRYNAGSSEMSATDFPDYLLPARGIAIFPRIVFIKTTFVGIIQLAVFRQGLNFSEELFPCYLVAFDVLNRVFLRVIPKTFFALRIPETLQSKAIAVSLFVLNGFSR